MSMMSSRQRQRRCHAPAGLRDAADRFGPRGGDTDSFHLLRSGRRREHRRLERAGGQQGGQLDFLSTQGYSKLGLPGNMLPNNATTNFVNTEFGLAFHPDSAFLRGMLEKTHADHARLVNGAVIAARSENDTGNNPHNPMYGIAKAGRGKVARASC